MSAVSQLLRPKEVATLLQVSARTVYALVASGQLRACRVGVRNGAIRVHAQDLADYVTRLRQQTCRSPDGPPVAIEPND